MANEWHSIKVSKVVFEKIQPHLETIRRNKGRYDAAIQKAKHSAVVAKTLHGLSDYCRHATAAGENIVAPAFESKYRQEMRSEFEDKVRVQEDLFSQEVDETHLAEVNGALEFLKVNKGNMSPETHSLLSGILTEGKKKISAYLNG